MGRRARSAHHEELLHQRGPLHVSSNSPLPIFLDVRQPDALAARALAGLQVHPISPGGDQAADTAVQAVVRTALLALPVATPDAGVGLRYRPIACDKAEQRPMMSSDAVRGPGSCDRSESPQPKKYRFPVLGQEDLSWSCRDSHQGGRVRRAPGTEA